MEDIDKRLGKFLRASRTEKRLSQRELAKSLGVAQDVISDWEQGKRSLKVSDIYEIAEALDISVARFLLLDMDNENRAISFSECIRYLLGMPPSVVYASEYLLKAMKQLGDFVHGQILFNDSIYIPIKLPIIDYPEYERKFSITGELKIREIPHTIDDDESDTD